MSSFPLCAFQLSFSPTTPMSSHGRVLSLLVAMLLSCCGLAAVCCITGYTHGMHTLAFMAAEVRCWTQDFLRLCFCLFSRKLDGWQVIFTQEMTDGYLVFRFNKHFSSFLCAGYWYWMLLCGILCNSFFTQGIKILQNDEYVNFEGKIWSIHEYFKI